MAEPCGDYCAELDGSHCAEIQRLRRELDQLTSRIEVIEDFLAQGIKAAQYYVPEGRGR